MDHRDGEDVSALALLAEPARRRLYDWVVAEGRPVGREEAAAAVGVSRALAAFHLDRLVDEGLLETEFRRLTGRAGPGAGRPAKLYRRGPREISVTLSDRRYELASRLFAEAIETLARDVPPDALQAAARKAGLEAGRTALDGVGRRPSRARRTDALLRLLRERGYEARMDADGRVVLGNCSFHALVEGHRELVCGMNRSIAEGIVEGLEHPGVATRIEPEPGLCCVAIEQP